MTFSDRQKSRKMSQKFLIGAVGLRQAETSTNNANFSSREISLSKFLIIY